MPTQQEEQQAAEFLKRAEIRTMKKDLQALREVDALKERDKIATLKTLEEQLAEKKQVQEKEAVAKEQRAKLEQVLEKKSGEEKIAEKDLKNYATEEERQQIFLFESQRLGFEKQIDSIDKEKDPALKLEKNRLLIQRRDQEAKLNSVLEQEKKVVNEQKFIVEREQATTFSSEKKALEQSRSETEKKIQDIEKKRWEAEKQLQDIDSKITKSDSLSEQLVLEKNQLRDKILGVDRSLREIYSVIIAREEEKRRGQSDKQKLEKEALAKIRAAEKEKIQREEWSKTSAPSMQAKPQIPVPVKKGLKGRYNAQAEEEQRRKFLQSIEQVAGKDKGSMQQKSNI